MPFRRVTVVACSVMLFLVGTAFGQINAQISSVPDPVSAPLVLTFQDAIARARKNLPQFLSAKTDFGLAHEDKVQARAALFPSVTYSSQFLYTEPNGTPSGVFIANNAVHEYVSQGHAHEAINLGGSEVQRTSFPGLRLRLRQTPFAHPAVELNFLLARIHRSFGCILRQSKS